MRNISPELHSEIQNGAICNVIKITLKDGTNFCYTDHDNQLIIDGLTYIPAAGLQKVKMTLTSSSEVSNQELASAWVDAPEDDLVSGRFDLATIVVGWASYIHPEYGVFQVFNGKLGEISWTDAGFKADIFSAMKALEKNVGTVFTANCRHTLFSQDGPSTIGACQLNDASWKATGSITSIDKNRWIFTSSNITQASGFFSNGKIRFTSGANAGQSYVVKNQTGGQLALFLPTSLQMTVGDTFEVWAGCDKTLSTCKNKFNNVVNFGGFPHIQPDVSFR